MELYIPINTIALWVNDYQSNKIDYMTLRERLVDILSADKVLILKNDRGVKIETSAYYIVFSRFHNRVVFY